MGHVLPTDDASAEERRRRGCASLVKRAGLGLAIVIVALAIMGTGYQAIAAAADSRNYPYPGQLVDVGGHRLHLYCLGEGGPTVILEGGAGEASPMWGWIQPSLASTTQVCAYDRAGFGWSESGPEPRAARQIVAELHALLVNSTVEPPYILAGHSFGGELVRLYADQHPDEVIGLVSIDARHPDQMQRMPELAQESETGRQLSTWASLVAPLGLMRLYWGEAGPNPGLPEPYRSEMRASYATSRPYRTQLAEEAAMADSDDQIRATGHLGDLPLIVVSQDTGGEWLALQGELAELSTNSQWRIVEGSSHMSLLTDAQHAAETAAAIRQLVEAGRQD